MPISPAADGYYHPSTEAEIQELVRFATVTGAKLRVRGAEHSVPRSIYTGGFPAVPSPVGELNLMLDRYREVRWDLARGLVTVEAGCNLGVDPKDPTGTSTYQNGLLFQLDRRGFALSHLGGITHQTVAGFVSTGSNGGSLRYTAYDDIVAVRVIDANGDVHELEREQDDAFFGAVVSMGLCGVISTVTFKPVPRYDLQGHETITTYANAPVDLFASGPGDVAHHFRQIDYGRMMWWPQKGVRRLVSWQADRMRPADYDENTSPGGRFTPRPYLELGKHPEAAAAIAGGIYDLFGRWQDEPDKLEKLGGVLAPLVRAFVPLDKKRKGPQRFHDTWYKALPMDNGVDDDKLPIEFSELFFPVERTGEVLRTLEKHFAGGLRATGTLACEIYPAKANPFWMHAAYGQDMMRVDFLWYKRNDGRPGEIFYPQYWELLKEIGFRVHWGKHVPSAGTPWHGLRSDPTVTSWTDYLRRRYPRWNDFLELRHQMDPKGTFLTRYWRRRFGL